LLKKKSKLKYYQNFVRRENFCINNY
jgi:hypothetical protein